MQKNKHTHNQPKYTNRQTNISKYTEIYKNTSKTYKPDKETSTNMHTYPTNFHKYNKISKYIQNQNDNKPKYNQIFQKQKFTYNNVQNYTQKYTKNIHNDAQI